MTRLVAVEVRRLLSRRLFWALLLVLAGVMILGNVLTAVHSNRDVAAARAKAERQLAQFGGPQGAVVQAARQSCEAAKAAGRIPRDAACGPVLADFYTDPRYFFTRSMPGNVVGVGVGVALLGLVLGAGAIGAEWSAGTFAGLLTWEPRRLRVLAAKLLALLGVVLLVAVAAIAVQVAAGWGIAATRGSTAGTTRSAVWLITLRSLRVLGVAGLFGLAGAALAGALRSTAGALGGVAGYVVAGEMVLRNLHPQWQRWLVSTNVNALVTGRTELFPVPGQRATFGPAGGSGYILHAPRGGLVLLLGVAALVAVCAVLLQRRDVT